jgi:hypothetical protein
MGKKPRKKACRKNPLKKDGEKSRGIKSRQKKTGENPRKSGVLKRAIWLKNYIVTQALSLIKDA